MENSIDIAKKIDLEYQLRDNLTRISGQVFVTGTQALARMLVLQQLLDRRNGLHTAGFVSGYRGSPLAAVDLEMWKAQAELKAHQITFTPAVNEDLAATMIRGTQQAGVDPERKVDGVYAMWYGKGPGIDRSGDAMHHGNAAGASLHGGVLLVLGDDHAATSSTIPNASELTLMGWSIPVVNPGSVEEYEEFGLWGWAASRYSSAWMGFKAISETVESGRAVRAKGLPNFVTPVDFAFPAGWVGYRADDFMTLAVEQRLGIKLDAVLAFARANPIDKLIVKASEAKIGIVTVGKAHYDVMETLRRFGLGARELEEKGIRIYKPGLTYPLEKMRLRAFAKGLREILVVEEKAGVVESQIKDILYNDANRPRVLGKVDETGAPLITWLGQLRPSMLAPAIAKWLHLVAGIDFRDQIALFQRRETLHNEADATKRMPYYCSGCPHNTSTKVPEGSRALAGIGCHTMAMWMNRSTTGLIHMGAEGADWAGMAPFSKTKHLFQNLGDGTYFHSGYLAVRQAIAAHANITYKILFNDAVAMTGGQPIDGPISVPAIAKQMLAEGVRKVVVVSDEPEKYHGVDLGADVVAQHRRELDAIQRELREIPGVTILIYDQTCAAEKRRRRKRNTAEKIEFPDPPKRLFINSAVCEGCGDCGVQSNCLSITPLETEFGRKRAIDQSSCNKDYSCGEGFCPSFVSVLGGSLRKGTAAALSEDEVRAKLATIAEPPATSLATPYNLMVCGIGGTGVITVGAIIAMAAHLEGKASTVLDFTALAQKGGAVLCHIRLADSADQINQVRIDWQESQAVVACDMVVGVLPDSLGTIKKGVTNVVANGDVAPVAEFIHNPDFDPHQQALLAQIRDAAGDDRVRLVNAHELAKKLFGDSIGANLLTVGYAWQMGWIPVGLAAIERAIELNGVAVAASKAAFAYGRLAAADPAWLEKIVPASASRGEASTPPSLQQLVTRRFDFLTRYQNLDYANAYKSFVSEVEEKERALLPAATRYPFTEAVAKYLFKLMAYKDEYEVARLYVDPEFRKQLAAQFEGDYRLNFQLAPPLIAKKNPKTGIAQKITFGPQTIFLFKILASLRGLRGTRFDIFRLTPERKLERKLIVEYKNTIQQLLATMSAANHKLAIEIASLPESIRGFGRIKENNVKIANQKEQELWPLYDKRPLNETKLSSAIASRSL